MHLDEFKRELTMANKLTINRNNLFFPPFPRYTFELSSFPHPLSPGEKNSIRSFTLSRGTKGGEGGTGKRGKEENDNSKRNNKQAGILTTYVSKNQV